MIELRYLVKESIEGAMYVLQYRYRYPLQNDSIHAYPPTDWVMSEWINVPNVKMDDEARAQGR